MKAVIYCRVSTKEQAQNLSLPMQRKACIEYCHQNAFETDQVFVDKGESAKTVLRPEFQKMLRYCRENKGKIQKVVVYSLNRFSRNTHDHLAISSLLGSLGIRLCSVTEPIEDSPIGNFLETVLAGVSQLDNDVKAVRTKAGMKAALESGRWPFPASLGYLHNGRPKGQSNIAPDSPRAPLIRKIFELHSTGLYTRPQVRDIVHDLGLRTRKGKKVSLQTFGAILKNPIYAGVMESRILDTPEIGHFEHLIDRALFDKVQTVLNGKKHTVTPYQRNHSDFPLRRFARCGECDRPLTASWSRGRSQKYAYYRCFNGKCNAVNCRKENLEKQFVAYLEQLMPNSKYVDLFKAIVLDRWHEQEAETVARSKSLQKHVDELRTRKDTVEEAFIYEKRIHKDTYNKHRDKLNEEIALAEIEAHDAKLEAFDMEGVLNFAQHLILNASRLWVEMSLDQKQRFQKVLFPQGVTFLNGEFGTAETCIFFKRLQESTAPESEVASPTGFEPVLPE